LDVLALENSVREQRIRNEVANAEAVQVAERWALAYDESRANMATELRERKRVLLMEAEERERRALEAAERQSRPWPRKRERLRWLFSPERARL
jgi:hypothetical protein